MASSSVPKHDFAPAWLKIPTNAQRPSGAISGESSNRRDESSNNINSHFSSKSRNSSNEQRRDRGRSAFSYRHHSIDTDEPQHHSPTYGSGGEYRLTSSQRQQSGSQPSLGRRPLSRQDFRDSSSPSFSSGNKGFNTYESAGDLHRNSSSSHWGRQRSFEHNHSSGNGRPSASSEHGSNASKKDGGKWKDDKIDKFDKEFPSLRGGKVDSALPTTNVTNGSVWDTNKSGKIHLSSSVNKKIHLIQKPIRNDIAKTNSSAAGSSTNAPINSSPKSVHRATLLKQTSKNVSNSTNATSVYHTLVPAKGSMVRRSSKDNVKSNGQSSKPTVRPNSPPSQSDVLNARLVTQPKRLGNKSEFLKELRDDGFGPYNLGSSGGYKIERDDKDTEADSQRNIPTVDGNEGDGSQFDYFDYDDKFHMQDSIQKELHQNGSSDHVDEDVDCVHQQQSFNGIAIVRPVKEDQMECKALSRSLEAEQRLLREMGWKEEDSEDEAVYAPLTEDEMKEFEKLSKQIPKRNGFQRNQLQFTWSPKRVLTIPKTLDLENESSGSSSTDTDSD